MERNSTNRDRSKDIPPVSSNKEIKDEHRHRQRCGQRRPPVPKHTERPIQYPPTQNNYVSQNAVRSVKETVAIDDNPHIRLVDSEDGHVISSTLKSGLLPQFVRKPGFGKVPRYLKKSPKVVVINEKKEPAEALAKRVGQKPIDKEILWLQDRWTELEQRLVSVSFSRPDKREAIEDELIMIENRLRCLTVTK